MENKIRLIREHVGLTQEELADLSKLDISVIQEYENGNHKLILEELKSIETALEVKYHYLLNINDGKVVHNNNHQHNQSEIIIPQFDVNDLKCPFCEVINSIKENRCTHNIIYQTENILAYRRIENEKRYNYINIISKQHLDTADSDKLSDETENAFNIISEEFGNDVKGFERECIAPYYKFHNLCRVMLK